MLTTSRSTRLGSLIDAAIGSLEIPDAVHQRVETRYTAAAGWLAAFWPEITADGLLYPQGSFRLGTVISPAGRDGEYDLDFVCRRDLLRIETSQAGLKADVGAGLRSYLAAGAEGGPLSDGKRCWTLGYAGEPFHMDVLPAIPDDSLGSSPNGILLTDKQITRWQHSNPIDYAAWFHQVMRQEFIQLSEILAKRMDVDDLPKWKIKTTLQRVVQVLKRHRDLYFEDRHDERPASIIITTLAAHAYAGGGDLYEVLRDTTERMPNYIEFRDGVAWVANPVQPNENFADRWRSHPARHVAFFEWLERVQADLAQYAQKSGLDTILESVARTLGKRQAVAAGAWIGSEARTAREAGALGVAASGVLGKVARKPVPQHTFHGGKFPHHHP